MYWIWVADFSGQLFFYTLMFFRASIISSGLSFRPADLLNAIYVRIIVLFNAFYFSVLNATEKQRDLQE
jgi:hypothetical protein